VAFAPEAVFWTVTVLVLVELPQAASASAAAATATWPVNARVRLTPDGIPPRAAGEAPPENGVTAHTWHSAAGAREPIANTWM
jgi:hypothetical protein